MKNKLRAIIGIISAVALLMSVMAFPTVSAEEADEIIETVENISVGVVKTGNKIFESDELNINQGGSTKDIVFQNARSTKFVAVRMRDWGRIREIEIFDASGNKLTLENGIKSVTLGMYNDGVFQTEFTEEGEVYTNSGNRDKLFDGNLRSHTDFVIGHWPLTPVALVELSEITAIGEIKVYTGFIPENTNTVNEPEGIAVYASKEMSEIFFDDYVNAVEALPYDHLVYNDIDDLSFNGNKSDDNPDGEQEFSSVKQVDFTAPRSLKYVAFQSYRAAETRAIEIEIYDTTGKKLTLGDGINNIKFGSYTVRSEEFLEKTGTGPEAMLDGVLTSHHDYGVDGDYWNHTIRPTFVVELSEITAVSKIKVYVGTPNGDHNEAIKIYVGDSVDTLFDEPLPLSPSDTPYQYNDYDEFFGGDKPLRNIIDRDNILSGLTPEVLVWETKEERSLSENKTPANLVDKDYASNDIGGLKWDSSEPVAVVFDLEKQYDIHTVMLSGALDTGVMISYNVYVGDDYDTLVSDANLLVSVNNCVDKENIGNIKRNQISVLSNGKTGRYIAFYVTKLEQEWFEAKYGIARIAELAAIGRETPVVTEPVYGDVDGDGQVTLDDLVLIRKGLLGMYDGSFTVEDLISVKKILSEKV